MMIEPQGRLILCHNVPLKNDMKDTILFSNTTAQLNYFQSADIKRHDLNNFTYIRENNIVRVPLKADDVYDCNYCLYRNVGFGDKWFFAFITKVEYVNPTTCALYLQEDVFQTWWFNVSIGKCMVEREHSKTDVVGENILDEGFDCSDTVINGLEKDYLDLTNWCAVATFANIDAYSGSALPPSSFDDNVYYETSCILPVDIDSDQPYHTASAIAHFINEHLKENETITDIVMRPYDLKQNKTLVQTGGICLKSTDVVTYNSTVNSVGNQIDGYTPKNNKMFTFPYNFMEVDNRGGLKRQYAFERMGNNTIGKFFLRGNIRVPHIVLTPRTYENLYNELDNGVPSVDFPSGDISDNGYLQYKANIQMPETLNKLAIPMLTSLTGVLTANPTLVGGGFAAVIGASASEITTDYIKSHSPANLIVSGAITDSKLMVGDDELGFVISRKSIRHGVAKCIDDFFTRYGYKVMEVKTPNTSGRTNFNYVKTNGCCVKGKAPVEALRTIETMFDSGLTLWHNTSKIGDYSDNPIG